MHQEPDQGLVEALRVAHARHLAAEGDLIDDHQAQDAGDRQCDHHQDCEARRTQQLVERNDLPPDPAPAARGLPRHPLVRLRPRKFLILRAPARSRLRAPHSEPTARSRQHSRCARRRQPQRRTLRRAPFPHFRSAVDSRAVEALIPQVWFDPLGTLLLLLITGIGLAALVKGADLLVEGAAGLAYRLGISKVIVGATVVSLGTTSPEAAVSVLAAWSGQAGLALGNAVGSVIADTGLIFGLGCLLATIPADRFVLNRQGWVQFGCALLLAAFCYGSFVLVGDAAALGRPVGLFFLALLVAYLAISVRWSRQHRAAEPFQRQLADGAVLEHVPPGGPPAESARGPVWLLASIVFGLALVILASRVVICAVSVLAVRWGVPEVVIAATLVAMGTSLPELVVCLTSLVKGHKELIIGNVIGADVLNVLFVIGASATAAHLPIVEAGSQVPRIFLYLHLPTMILILVLFRLYIFAAVRRGAFRRWFGLPLVLIYVAYVVAQFLLTAGSGGAHELS
ncbi:MAG: hypothetical protein GF330_03465 [Candidatus Eisenbacteria bacterium]|nr:hypothetical protein [Candidatus Eisenbacteria bacterium]